MLITLDPDDAVGLTYMGLCAPDIWNFTSKQQRIEESTLLLCKNICGQEKDNKPCLQKVRRAVNVFIRSLRPH